MPHYTTTQGWDAVKDIQKNHLVRRVAKLKVKKLRQSSRGLCPTRK